ncbi:MAG: hypothetical protein KKB30_04675 [Proteobacteria bacterium]|nr:hypothetical protein [Pseudomonadota bacterium]MBU1715497.1 hypothetical protein [Pseudomonadota bacterium]
MQPSVIPILFKWTGMPVKNGRAPLIIVSFLLLYLMMPARSMAFWPIDHLVDRSPVVVKINQVEGVQAAELQEQIRTMAADLVANLTEPDPESGVLAEGLLVCTFVDLNKLYRTSSFGRYLSEQLMGEFQRNQYRVIELRKSTAVLVQERRGEYGLSRDPAEISATGTADTMLTGTYTVTGESIMVNARIIDNRSSALLASSTMIFPRNCLSEVLLADTASARVNRSREPIYMKRLNL